LPDGVTYTPTQDPIDDYRCFPVEWPFQDQRKYVTGFEAIPGERAIQHHIVVYAVPKAVIPALRQLDDEEPGPGYKCFGGALPDRLSDEGVRTRIIAAYPEAFPDGHPPRDIWVGHWAPGMRGNDLPAGSGLPIPPGSLLVVQVHYFSGNAPGRGGPGGEVRFKVADQVERPGFVLPMTADEWLDGKNNRSLVVPPGGEASVSLTHTFDEIIGMGAFVLDLPPSRIAAVELTSVNLHMHSYGKNAQVTLLGPGGSSETLLDIPAWDLGFQRDFDLVRPKVIAEAEARDWSLRLDCHYGNRGDAEIYGGYGSNDEMCFDFSFLSFRLTP
jgi:hypothetical protein